MATSFYVYIVSTPSSSAPSLHVGVTPDLPRRLSVLEEGERREPKQCPRLVYVEKFSNAAEACVRERKIRAWRVPRKVALIEARNPAWLDLTAPSP